MTNQRDREEEGDGEEEGEAIVRPIEHAFRDEDIDSASDEDCAKRVNGTKGRERGEERTDRWQERRRARHKREQRVSASSARVGFRCERGDRSGEWVSGRVCRTD